MLHRYASNCEHMVVMDDLSRTYVIEKLNIGFRTAIGLHRASPTRKIPLRESYETVMTSVDRLSTRFARGGRACQ